MLDLALDPATVGPVGLDNRLFHPEKNLANHFGIFEEYLLKALLFYSRNFSLYQIALPLLFHGLAAAPDLNPRSKHSSD